MRLPLWRWHDGMVPSYSIYYKGFIMKKLIAVTSLLALSAALPAFAASDDMKAEMKKMCDQHFAEMDTDKNDKVSKEEHDAFSAKMFLEADADKDGFITREEKDAFREKMMEDKKAEDKPEATEAE